VYIDDYKEIKDEEHTIKALDNRIIVQNKIKFCKLLNLNWSFIFYVILNFNFN